MIALSVCLLQGCKEEEAQVPYYNTADLTPAWQNTSEPHQIADFEFVDQNGEVVTNKTFDNKLYVASFFFTTCPGICPKMHSNMKVVAEAYADRDDVKFLSHTVTPYIDTVEQLNAYAEMHYINAAQWRLVTGAQGKIYDIARKSYFAEDEIGLSADSTEFLHTERFVLVDKNKQIRGVYNGTVLLEMERLKADIDLLLKEG